MYSSEDVKDMLTDLKIKINKKTEDEINYYLNMTGKLFFFYFYSCLCTTSLP